MKEYLHWTAPSDLPRIQAEGLKTGKELGIQNHYRGIPIDNGYIYLAKGIPGSMEDIHKKKAILKVMIPDDHPVERDMDALVYLRGARLDNPWELLNLSIILSGLGARGEVDPTDAGAMGRILSEAGVDRWDNIFSFYRTPEPIRQGISVLSVPQGPDHFQRHGR